MSKPITFTGTKLRLLDLVCGDPQFSDLDFRVLYYIASSVDRESELAIRSRETIAVKTGASSIRGVDNSIARLAARRVIKVERGGGRGMANVYRLTPETATLNAPFPAVGTQETGTSNAGFKATETLQTTTRNPAFDDTKTLHTLHPFPLSSQESSLPNTAADVASCRMWRSILEVLTKRHGPDLINAWLGKARGNVNDGVLTIEQPTKYLASEARTRLGDAITSAALSVDATIGRVEVTVGSHQAGGGENSPQDFRAKESEIGNGRRRDRSGSTSGGMGRLAIDLARAVGDEDGTP
jgi:hypothetical protein